MSDSIVRSIVTAGYAPLDIAIHRDKVWHAAGGTAGNVAAILGYLGWRATLVAAVGDDLAGAVLRHDLGEARVGVWPLKVPPGLRTPRIIHEIHDASHAYRYSCPHCGKRLPKSRPLTVAGAHEVMANISAPDVFFFDRLNAGTLTLAEHFAESGSSIVFEPSRPARPELVRRVLAIAEIVKISAERSDALEISDGRSGQIWIRTEGQRGAFYRVGTGKWRHSSAFEYPLVDAGGAGDWTTAGLLHAVRSGRRTVGSVGDGLRWGQALAAVSCGFAGARGLARHNTPDSVVAAATSLETRRMACDTEAIARPSSAHEIPKRACSWCLQPLAPA